MKKQHGGARKGAGRRYLNGSDPHEGTPLVTVTISLTAADRDMLRDLGNGNVSAGVRRAVEIVKEVDRLVKSGEIKVVPPGERENEKCGTST